MKNKEEILNFIYTQLTEIYYLKSICLEVLKELESKHDLTEKEENWRNELYQNVFYTVDD